MSQKNLYLIIGPNTFRRDLELQELSNNFVQNGGGKDQISKYDFSDFDRITELEDEVKNVSLFSPMKLSIINGFIKEKVPEESLESLADTADQNSWIIFVDSEARANSKVVKNLKNKEAEVMIFKEISGSELQSWVLERAEKYKLKISASQANLLIDRVGESQQQIDSELKKLSAFAAGSNASGQDGNEITDQDIKDLVEATPRSSVFAMLDAINRGDIHSANELFEDQLSQGEPAQKIWAMIIWQITQLAIVVDQKGRPAQEIATNYGVSTYTQRKLSLAASKLSKRDIRELVAEIADIDASSRTSSNINLLIGYFISYFSNFLATK